MNSKQAFSTSTKPISSVAYLTFVSGQVEEEVPTCGAEGPAPEHLLRGLVLPLAHLVQRGETH